MSQTLTTQKVEFKPTGMHYDKLRTMTKEEFIDKHGSGTLRKNTRLGMKTHSQYIEERIAWEFGYEFRAEYASRVLIGECISEGDVKGYTDFCNYTSMGFRKPRMENSC